MFQIASTASDLRRRETGAARAVSRLFALLAALIAASAPAEDPPELFLNPAPQTQTASLGSTPASGSVLLARLNPVVAGQLRNAPAGVPLRISLSLSSSQQRTAVIDRRRVSGPGRLVCRGHVDGVANSLVILALSGEALAGSISIPGQGSFQIQQAAGNQQRIRSVDPDLVPSCGVRADPDDLHKSGSWSALFAGGSETVSTPPAPVAQFQAAAATNAAIDLLVVYTAAAREGAGGTNGIEALIDVAVEEANLAFENSAVQAQLQLVHREEIAYQETGDISEDLDALEEDDHGGATGTSPLARVHELRLLHRADVVSLITETTGGPLGLANLMHDLDLSFSERAFSVVQRAYANAYYVLAHEVGHNLGCQHDRATSSGNGCFEYSRAHHFMAGGLRYHTIMAYQPGLPTAHFSNPDILFQGVPTGVPEGATNSANNARTINLTAPVVAQFSSVLRTGTPPSIRLTAPANGASLTAGNILLAVDTADDDGQVVRVKYVLNGEKLAEVRTPPFTFLWTNALPGSYSLEAEATDDAGWETDGTRVGFTVIPAPPAFDVAASGPNTDGTVLLRIRGTPGGGFRIDASPDLTSWVPLATNVLILDVIDVVDLEAPGWPARFYRILPPN